tara:strand:+ start:1431 stop:1532 length:102 start_codon:yes stop_codon:yes gene_type:complete
MGFASAGDLKLYEIHVIFVTMGATDTLDRLPGF